MLWTPILALLLLPLTFASAALEVEHDKLVKLAAASNGVIKLDESTFNLLTHPKRTWSAAIQFTAMDGRRRCNPCRCVPEPNSSFRSLILRSREFGPAWDTVAKAWTKTSAEHRNSHFFATIDFDNAQSVFQRVSCER
jgi:oligosaccharyltransferase complex subunit gamma